jgi:copper chaperone CopZ
MKKNYELEGMTCSSCRIKVTGALLKLQEVQEANVELNPQRATITMNRALDISELQAEVHKSGDYTIRETAF